MKKFYKDWKMTVAQHYSYFNLLEAVYRRQGIIDSKEKESMRKLIHTRAFGSAISAKVIDHLKGFDDFKAECLAWSQPSDVDAQLQMALQPLIRLRYRIRELADEPYILAFVRGPLFGKQALEDLDEPELERLRNTLCDRLAIEHKPETLARRRGKREPAVPLERRPF